MFLITFKIFSNIQEIELEHLKNDMFYNKKSEAGS